MSSCFNNTVSKLMFQESCCIGLIQLVSQKSRKTRTFSRYCQQFHLTDDFTLTLSFRKLCENSFGKLLQRIVPGDNEHDFLLIGSDDV